MILRQFILAILISLPITATCQTLTPEEVAAMVDQQMSNLNPYQELLNNPDPARSLAAMKVMLESGDEALVRMALQYGILSPNQTVKRVAFESYLQTSPILSIRFNGEDIKDSYFSSTIREHWNGTLDSDNVGYWRIPVGEYRQDEDCYAETLYNDCFITVNSDGVFLTPYSMNARAIISDEGLLTGSAILRSVDDPVPFTIRLID